MIVSIRLYIPDRPFYRTEYIYREKRKLQVDVFSKNLNDKLNFYLFVIYSCNFFISRILYLPLKFFFLSSIIIPPATLQFYILSINGVKKSTKIPIIKIKKILQQILYTFFFFQDNKMYAKINCSSKNCRCSLLFSFFIYRKKKKNYKIINFFLSLRVQENLEPPRE